MARPLRRADLYPAAKRVFDVAGSLALLPVAGLVALGLVALNPWLNPGPLLFRQRRLGAGGRAFAMLKFRSMTGPGAGPRFADADAARITRLGRLLRRLRLDELPQAVNVLRGEMSLIGPRPDDLTHARFFLLDVPRYRERHAIRPGITGLAQVELGYMHGRHGACRKTALDLHYIRHARPGLDAWIFWRTLRTVADLKGQ